MKGEDADALIVILTLVWVFKFTELDAAHHVLAARLVALGDNLRDAYNIRVTGPLARR